MGLDKMKSRWDKFAESTFTEPFETAKDAANGEVVGQTRPEATKYFQKENNVSPFDVEKLNKKDHLVELMKDKIVTSKMSNQIYNPSEYAPKNLAGGDQDLDSGVNAINKKLGQRGGQYDVDGPHR